MGRKERLPRYSRKGSIVGARAASRLTSLPGAAVGWLGRQPRLFGLPIAAVYGVLAAFLVGYLASLILRPAEVSWPLLDNWAVAAFELTAASLCLIGALRHRGAGHTFAFVLGGALLSWATGDLLLAGESWLGPAVTPPTVADVFYLGFYPFAYAGIVLLIRQEVSEFLPATWLDGAVAGLGAAALCGAFAFDAIAHTLGGSPLTIATNLAYPIGDVLLFGLAAGGTALMAGRRPSWFLLAAACALNALGDTFNLIDVAGKTSHFSLVVDGIAWPITILLISMVAWLPAPRVNLGRARPGPGFLLPGLGACAALTILYIGSWRHVSAIAAGLATLTLMAVGVRLALSIRSLRVLNEQRRRLSVTDDLTGLGNRRQLVQTLNGFFAGVTDGTGAHRRLAFLFMDLDHFKEINDSFGHSAGDEILRQLGPRLKASLRSSDLLVRLGGDELGVLLIDTDPDYCQMVARRLLKALETPFLIDDVSVRISASIGVAVAPTDAMDTAGLLRCADVAMYRAKERRSAVEVYSQELAAGGSQLLLVTQLGVAIAQRQFVLHYQPQLDLTRQRIVAVEALLRWPHPQLGMVAPLRFLPLAEEAGKMGELTALVIDQALIHVRELRQAYPDLRASVNVSTTNLLDADFVPMVEAALARYQLPADSVVLEITETMVLREFERCKGVIARLRDLEVQVSMDDFGAGFTSLAYLGDLALSEIKLDRAFTAVLATPGRHRELVRATIDLCHALGLRVVAEGIEDQFTIDLLIEMGCDVGQGYFIGRPCAVGDLRPLIEAAEHAEWAASRAS